MDTKKYGQILLAALMIVAVGAVAAMAAEELEEKNVTVEVKVDEKVEFLSLNDLADGEEREINAGEHTITLRRSGDEIDVLMDGEDLESGLHKDGLKVRKMVILDDDEVHGDHPIIIKDGGYDNFWQFEDGKKIKIIKVGEGGDHKILGAHGDHEIEEMLIALKAGLNDGDEHSIDIMVEHLSGDHEAMFLEEGEMVGGVKVLKFGGPDGGMVHYRCEDTGSILLIKKEHATEEAFIDPATGCEMKKVEGATKKIVVKKKIHIEDVD